MNITCISSNTIDLRNTSSFLPLVYLPNEWILINIVWPSIAFVGLAGNITFIWTVIKVSVLHTSTFIVLAVLAFSDLLSVLGRLIYTLHNLLTSPLRYGDDINVIAIIGDLVTWFCFTLSVSLITLVSAERFLAICHPIKYRALKGSKGMLAVVSTLIFGSICLAFLNIPYSLTFAEYCVLWPATEQFLMYPRKAQVLKVDYLVDYVDPYFVIYNIIILTGTAIFLLINCFMYIVTLKTLIKRKQNRKLQTSAQLERNIRQASVMVIANGFVYCVCVSIFLLLLALQISRMFGRRFLDMHHSIVLSDITHTFMLINASVNPIVYFITNQSYRKNFKKIILRGLCK